ncbi:hypothetical protein ACH5RR_028582 [Cinchona calisaya]|uniref:Uncharacterized protein n=1 Tax=Cinchona calisaya TaxID=153742 RepID=A0ABD2YP75_9GENT
MVFVSMIRECQKEGKAVLNCSLPARFITVTIAIWNLRRSADGDTASWVLELLEGSQSVNKEDSSFKAEGSSVTYGVKADACGREERMGEVVVENGVRRRNQRMVRWDVVGVAIVAAIDGRSGGVMPFSKESNCSVGER